MSSFTQWDVWIKKLKWPLSFHVINSSKRSLVIYVFSLQWKIIKNPYTFIYKKRLVRHLWNDVSSCFISDCWLPDSRGAVNHDPILVGAASFIWNALEGSLDHEIILISSKWCCGGDSLLPHLELYDVDEHGHRETDVVSSGEGTPRGNRPSSPRVYHWSHLKYK